MPVITALIGSDVHFECKRPENVPPNKVSTQYQKHFHFHILKLSVTSNINLLLLPEVQLPSTMNKIIIKKVI